MSNKKGSLIFFILLAILATALSGLLVGGFPLKFVEELYTIQMVGSKAPKFALKILPLIVDLTFWSLLAIGSWALLNQSNKEHQQQNSEKVEEKELTDNGEKNKTIIYVALLFIVILGITCYVYRNKLENYLSIIPTDTETEKPQEITEPPTPPNYEKKWVTYTNKELGFELQIPENWEATVEPHATKTDVIFSPHLTITSGIYYNQDFQRELSFEEVVEMHQPANRQEPTDYKIANVTGKSYNYNTGPYTKQVLIDFPNPHLENGVFTIKYQILPDNEGVVKDVEKALETFTFIDQLQTDAVENWKTYTAGAFSFKYPAYWREPETTELNTRVKVIFKDGQEPAKETPAKLEVSWGLYHSKSTQQGLTLEELKEQRVLSPEEKITVKNWQGYRYTYHMHGVGNYITSLILAQSETPEYILSINYRHANTMEEYKPEMPGTLSKILSTFEFE